MLHIYLMVTQVPSLCALFCKSVSLPFKVKQKRNKHESNKCTFRVAPRQGPRKAEGWHQRDEHRPLQGSTPLFRSDIRFIRILVMPHNHITCEL